MLEIGIARVTRTAVSRRDLMALAFAVLALFSTTQASSRAETPSPACPPPPNVEPSRDSSAQAPTQTTIACIDTTPITLATFEHWETIALADSAGPKAHVPSHSEILSEVMGFLTSSDWVRGEAHLLGISVKYSKVHREFEHVKREQFPRPAKFRQFLSKSRQTVADLMFRVELNLLSMRIQRHVTAGHRGARSEQEALAHFVTHFKDFWKAQTYCSPSYDDAQDCGHIQNIG